jgi:hypothetical protein
MKIKDCMACKLKEDDVVNFLRDTLANMMVYESLYESIEGWYDDAKNDPDACYTKDFLDHMQEDHSEEIKDMYQQMVTKADELSKEVF